MSIPRSTSVQDGSEQGVIVSNETVEQSGHIPAEHAALRGVERGAAGVHCRSVGGVHVPRRRVPRRLAARVAAARGVHAVHPLLGPDRRVDGGHAQRRLSGDLLDRRLPASIELNSPKSALQAPQCRQHAEEPVNTTDRQLACTLAVSGLHCGAPEPAVAAAGHSSDA